MAKHFENRAGHGKRDPSETDVAAKNELCAAGITDVQKMPEFMRHNGEVGTVIIGQVGPWMFQRAWCYWIATGPGIPVEVAEELYEAHRSTMFVEGHCGLPSPREECEGFGVGMYHVYTHEALRDLVLAIDSIRTRNVIVMAKSVKPAKK